MPFNPVIIVDVADIPNGTVSMSVDLYPCCDEGQRIALKVGSMYRMATAVLSDHLGTIVELDDEVM